MIIDVHAYTTKFYKKPINEDGIFVNEVVLSDGYYHSSYQLDSFNACVCDGVTGADKGFYASQFILQTIANGEYSNFDDFKHLLVSINDELIEEGIRIKSNDMSSTIAGIYFEDNNAYIYHVGDSRVYQIRGDNLALLTEDDALAYKLYKDGMISEREIKTHPHRNVLVDYFGNKKDFMVKTSEEQIIKKAKYFICSDGISDFIDSQKLSSIVTMEIEGFDMLRLLVGEALKNGCNDDVSAIIIEVQS